jgi:nitric oxide reductase NorD protein
MKPAQLTARFFDLVSPDIPNEWDVEEVLDPFADESEAVCEAALSHVPVIWPVSHALCYDFLRLLPEALQHLSLDQLPPWLGITLDLYETNGLRAAQRFMQDDIKSYLAQLEGNGGLSLSTVKNQLSPYIRGIARDDLQISTAKQCYTDTTTIFLPEELRLFPNNDENFLLYKLLLTFQWGFISCNSFQHLGNNTQDLRTFLANFDNQPLASAIYQGLESIRVRFFLNDELPGLMRAAKKQIFCKLQTNRQDTPPDILQNALLASTEKRDELLNKLLPPEMSRKYIQGTATPQDSRHVTAELYAGFSQQTDKEVPFSPLAFQGIFKLQAVESAMELKEQKMGEQFADLMATHLLSLSKKELDAVMKNEQNKENSQGLAESDISMVMDSEFAGTADQERNAPILITINNQEIDLPLELEEFTKTFLKEFGHLPARFLSSAAGKAGQAMLEHDIQAAGIDSDTNVHSTKTSYYYDEWDYRRQGYRKNWCSLQYKALLPVHSSFIRKTLDKYHGLTLRLRHQFEMMRSQEHFVKRQREGDDIDFDALVESISDSRAGLHGSERLFIRLKRDERDIAAFFLVDMSNSTAGWINTALKESLVLMAEAMEVLGDRYAIYGFSGMRRSRCEFFHVKHIHEPYGEKVRERLTSIAPSEYTRMGPAIRHATKLLQDVDARVRLIITLTDGKPEDYDDYKGQYAIEDTRHALLEAKTADIHPFCITIDQHAHEYMQHMYGPANYIFINDVRKLPVRMPEIYRTLTS